MRDDKLLHRIRIPSSLIASMSAMLDGGWRVSQNEIASFCIWLVSDGYRSETRVCDDDDDNAERTLTSTRNAASSCHGISSLSLVTLAGRTINVQKKRLSAKASIRFPITFFFHFSHGETVS